MRASLLLAPLLLSACAGAPEPPARLNAREARELESALAGKVAGEPQRCVRRESQVNLRAISSEVLLYRVNKTLVYRNDLIGRCSGLGFGDTLVVETFGSQYCRGDMARSVDLRTGIQHGACALGDFTPYRTPGK